MKYLKPARISGALVLALTAIVTPVAASQDTGVYLGANLGRSTTTIDAERIARALNGAGFTVSSFDDDRDDTAYKLFGGYQFNSYFAIEGGYFDLGESSFTATTSPDGMLTGNLQLDGLSLDLVGLMPLTQKTLAFGRVGLNHVNAKTVFTGTGAISPPDSGSKRSTDYKFGLGLQYDFTQRIGMRLEAERYRFDDAIGNEGDLDLYSLSMIFRFGGNDQAPATSVAAVTPAPTSRPVATTPAPVPRTVTFSADLLFDFDQATVKPRGRDKLDKLAKELRGTEIGFITVIGHTDRTGTQAYNKILSTQRAEAVKIYLVTFADIPASKILVRGNSDSNPVTLPGQCKGQTRSNALIACLQPDRRVEVKVSGTN